MIKMPKKRSNKRGLLPGSLVHIGDKYSSSVLVTCIKYNEIEAEEKVINIFEDILPEKDINSVFWINIDGLHDVSVIEKIGKHFNIHPLTLEDILNTEQRPKFEDFDEYIYIVLNMLMTAPHENKITTEQVSLIIGKNFVLSFQERKGDVFDFVRDRIRTGKGKLRKFSSDYLGYALLDAIIDNYFIVIEKLGEQVEVLEDELMMNPGIETLKKIYELKRDIIYLKKSVWPLREVSYNLERDDSSLIKETTRVFLRDIYDHTIQVIDAIETFRDTLSGMLEIYLSTINNRMNEVMKVLTMISTIFIPITFIASIYGMNFNTDVSKWNMPELNSKFGYFSVLGIMLIVVFLQFIFFKKKKWF